MFTLWVVSLGFGFPRVAMTQDTGQLMALANQHAEVLPLLVAGLAVLAPLMALALGTALIPVIEWRIGVRRRGLRKL